MGRKITKYYEHNGLAGCVSQYKNQHSKTVIGIYNNEQAGFDEDKENPWATVCEKHSSIVEHSSLSKAKQWATDPLMWCEGCQKEAEERKAES